MPDSDLSPPSPDVSGGDAGLAARKRPKPGERRDQVLAALAAMLEQPGADRITTAALAAKLEVSEAALYRHFASKAQMFEGLIEFIERSVFSLVNQITERELAAVTADTPNATDVPKDAHVGIRQARKMLVMLMQFAEKNPGLARVMAGDALVYENARLQQRMNQFFERFESSLKHCLRGAAQAQGSTTPTVDAQVRASALTAFAMGRLQRYARSDYKRLPSEYLEASLALLL
jgi:TetR/AcrR family transcriptional regulator